MNQEIKVFLLLLFASTTVLRSQNEKLEVTGAIQISDNDDPTPDAGTIRWTGVDFEGYDGTSWVSLTMNGIEENVIDIDNNKYETITIGSQTWMAENLRVTRYNDGTPIPYVFDAADWQSSLSPAMVWLYNGDYGDPDFGAPEYGALYNYFVVADTNSHNVCPIGWHVPTDTELTTLIDFVDPGPPVDPDVFGVQSSVAGGLLKESGLAHWDYFAGIYATNDFGFNVLPAGNRSVNGTWGNPTTQTSIWSSSSLPFDDNNALYRYFNFADNNVLRVNLTKQFGFSVRCIKD